MKITTFDPIISTHSAEDVIKVFEALGFEQKHAPVTTVKKGDVHSFRMEDANGFHVDIAASLREDPDDLLLIRMNVDNFDEAYRILTDHGFKTAPGSEHIDTKSASALTMIAPSGFRIAIVKHIK